MDEKYNLNFDSLKMEILNSISKQVGEGAKVHAENIEDEKFRDEIKNVAGKWGESVYDAAQVAVLVPTGLFAFDQFFSLPDMDISMLGIGSHRYFLFHSAALITTRMCPARSPNSGGAMK